MTKPCYSKLHSDQALRKRLPVEAATEVVADIATASSFDSKDKPHKCCNLPKLAGDFGTRLSKLNTENLEHNLQFETVQEGTAGS